MKKSTNIFSMIVVFHKILCTVLQDQDFSCNVSISDKVFLLPLLNEISGNVFIVIIYIPIYDVTTFEIYFSNQVVFLHD